MRSKRLCTASAVATLIWAATTTAAAGPPRDEARFVPLGSLPGGAYGEASRVRDMTPDGSVIVGDSPSSSSRFRTEAFRWDWENGMVGLGDFEGPDFSSSASGVSDDGEVIVGGATNSWQRSGALFRWEEATGLRDLGLLVSDEWRSEAHGVSGDGHTIIGTYSAYYYLDGGNQAYHRTEEAGMQRIFELSPGYVASVPWDASYDGSVIVGLANFKIGTASHSRAFRWEESTGMVDLGFFTDEHRRSLAEAKAVSADGSVVAGWSYREFAEEAFRWDPVNGMVGLGTAGEWRSVGLGLSSDGRFVVGLTGAHAFVWDEEHGMRFVRDVLEGEYGLDLGAWQLTEAVAISTNGRVIAGKGRNPDDDKQGWVAVLPWPRIDASIDIDPGKNPNPIRPGSRIMIRVALLGSEALDVEDVNLDTLAFGPAGASPLRGRIGPLVVRFDVNRDGFQDLTSFYWTNETGIGFGDATACLTADTWDESIVEGCDAIVTKIDCGGGFGLAMLVPIAFLVRRFRR